ncbi:MAG: GNAT family N-acetyltransferase [Ilumatobacteraceae bacterium]
MIVRPMTVEDLPALIEVQEAGAVVGMAEVFPQELYPFPRDSIVDRWRGEIEDPAIDCFVATDDTGERQVGFAATTGRELLHFGTAIETWGQGVASELLDVVVDRLRAEAEPPMLRVFADNGRARRFYAKHGWQPTGASSRSGFPPYPVLLEYVLPTR